MYRLECDKDTYLKLQECLSEFMPSVKLTLLACDETLCRLGFVSSPPCVLLLHCSEKGMRRLLDDLDQTEINAFSSDDGRVPLAQQPDYLTFLRYGWMYGVLLKAEKIPDAPDSPHRR